MRTEAGERLISRCYTSGFENGVRSHESRNAGGLKKLEKNKEIR